MPPLGHEPGSLSAKLRCVLPKRERFSEDMQDFDMDTYLRRALDGSVGQLYPAAMSFYEPSFAL